MKQILTLLFAWLLMPGIKAQIINDDCFHSIDLGTMDAILDFQALNNAPYDTCLEVSTVGATPAFPYLYTDSSCGSFHPTNIVSNDVWFRFVTYGRFRIYGLWTYNTPYRDSINITFWKGSSCSQLRAVEYNTYVIDTGNPSFSDEIWIETGGLSFDTVYAQISNVNNADSTHFYFCISAVEPSAILTTGCYFAYANQDTICFEYNKHKTDATTGNNGTAAITMLRGNGPYSFLWSDGNTDSLRTNLGAGIYYVTITDTGGCAERDSIIIFSQCPEQVHYTYDGLANYNFIAQSDDTISEKQFTWIIAGDTIAQDSTVSNIHYQFDSNGTYNVCLKVLNTSLLCYYDTCFILPVVNAEYIPLLDTINIWHYVNNTMPVLSSTPPAPRSLNCSINSYWFSTKAEYTEGDTLINGKAYKGFWSQANQWPVQYCQAGFIREEISTRKIYYLPVDSTSEILLYNFGMLVGDTVYLNFFAGGIFQSDFYRLDSIGAFTAEHTASPKSVYFLSSVNHPQYFPLKWVEGIGTMIELVYPYARFLGWDGNLFPCPEYSNPSGEQVLVCYEHTRLEFYDNCALSQAINNSCFNYADTCNYYNICGGINEISSIGSFSIFPNPSTKNDLNLELQLNSSGTVSVRVVDIQSREVSPTMDLGKLSEGMHTQHINVNLPAGLYFLECNTEQGRICRKFVVQ